MVEETYRAKGYNFIFLTDHNNVTPDPDVGCKGEQCILHIASGEDGWLCRHHMVVLGIHNPDLVSTTNTSCISENTIQERIDTFLADGALVVLAHPAGDYALGGVGPTYEQDELLNNFNYTGIEIWTPGSNSIDWWDSVLMQGRQVWGFASDDCEDLEGGSFNRGWLMVNTEKGPLTYYADNNKEDLIRQDIVQNIKTGNFYAVVRGPNGNPETNTDDSGPMLIIWVDGPTLHVLTDQPDSIIRFITGNGPQQLETPTPELGASYTITGTESFIRVEVEQMRNGVQYMAYSQPIFVRDRDATGQGAPQGHACKDTEKCLCGLHPDGLCYSDCVPQDSTALCP